MDVQTALDADMIVQIDADHLTAAKEVRALCMLTWLTFASCTPVLFSKSGTTPESFSLPSSGIPSESRGAAFFDFL
jgi:hypothetical protein